VSLKEIYTVILNALPATFPPGLLNATLTIQQLFFFGARPLAQFAPPFRMVFVPVEDTYTPRRRQGGSVALPVEIYGYEALVDIHFEAPIHEDIDAAHGLRDLIVSICDACFAGSFRPISGQWDLDSGSAQGVRGEHYTLRVAFMRPVVAPDQTKVLILTSLQGGHFEEPGP
jgi:hypothetical protein